MTRQVFIMAFSSLSFLFLFLPFFLILYYCSPFFLKNMVLLAGSLCFYAWGTWGNPFHFFLLPASVLVSFTVGNLMEHSRTARIRKQWFYTGVLYHLFWLILFKYTSFAGDTINSLLSAVGKGGHISFPHLLLPIGISFYTFQNISYLADVYHRKIHGETSLLRFGTFLCMFPQLISGPLVPYSVLCRELKKRRCSLSKADKGLRLFVTGLGMKVLLADRLGGLWNSVGAIGFESISTPLAWLGILAYSLQIYFDFYGYSRMAMGLGLMLGFHLPVNFRHPYLALSMTDFWRRWHITLGGWFRDYVYIPLGGNRKGILFMVRNTCIVWLLTGIWHGAGWNFILWGLFLFLIIILEKAGFKRFLEFFPPAGHLYMAFLIPLSWTFFAITDIRELQIYLCKLFPFFQPDMPVLFSGDMAKYTKQYLPVLLLALLFCTRLPGKLYKAMKNTWPAVIFLLAVFWASVYCLCRGMNDPFLYFQF